MVEEEEYGSKLLFPFLAIIAGLILDEVNKHVKFLGIPDSILQFLFAMCVSIMLNNFLPSSSAAYIDASFSWTSVEPQTILMILLPPLLFESSFKINSHTFYGKLRLIAALTVFLYVFSLLLSAIILLPVLHTTQNINISGIFLFISIIVATDPVAVVAMLEEYGAPHRLRLLIEGESLLNDGLALTTYRILVEVLRFEVDSSYSISYGSQCFGLFMCIVVSPLIGAIGAAWVAWAVSKTSENKKQQAIIVVSVYGMYLLCDAVKGSSALGLVFFGVTLNYYKEVMTAETVRMALSLWQTLGYWANNVIFMFAGYMVGREVFTAPASPSQDTYMSIATEDIFTVMLGVLIAPVPFMARVISVWMFYQFHSYFCRSDRPPATRSEYVILAYAGLRGALGLILAMELTKTDGLELSPDSKKILLLTCSITFTCLVFQGMTFPAVSNKEGTTKRSKYIKDTRVRLSRYLTAKIHLAMVSMQHSTSGYLRGTNWKTVESTVSSCMKGHMDEMETEWNDQVGNELFDPWAWDDAPKPSKLSSETSDAKIGFYGILLARIQDSWSHGAISGNTAHILVALLEHGIDEGNITAGDIEDHLDVIEPSRVFNCISNGIEFLYVFISGPTCINRFATMGGPAFFPRDDKLRETITKRDYEKWWIFHTMTLAAYTILLSWANFDTSDHVSRSAVYISYSITCLMALMEAVCIYHYKLFRSANSAETQETRTHWSDLVVKEFVPLVVVILLTLASFGLSIVMLDHGRCMRTEGMSLECSIFRIVHFSCVVCCLVYRILRMTPALIVVLREYCVLKKLSRDRIRLAALHGLHHLSSETKISKQLFSESAYRIVRREHSKFIKFVEGLMRLELKEHMEEISTIPVVKTRQAVRMMSFALDEILADLKTEGFMPDDAEDRWRTVVAEMRAAADDILVVEAAEIRPYLECVSWIRALNATEMPNIVSYLTKQLSQASHLRTFSAGQIIKTHGQMFFVRKGFCKVTEQMPQQDRHHEYYLTQGDLVGERNMLLLDHPSVDRPMMCPKIRYETTTYCEMVEVTTTTMRELLRRSSDIYRHISNLTQARRFIIELRDRRHANALTMHSFWSSFTEHGLRFGEPRQLHVFEGKTAIVGCWTKLISMVPLSNMDKSRHIKGPAIISVEPADQRSDGMIYFDKIRSDESVGTVEEHSNISLMHDPEHKVRERTHLKPIDVPGK